MKILSLLILFLVLFSCKKKEIRTPDNDYYKKARIYREAKSKDSAFYYYNLAKNEYIKTNDSLGVGNSLINMALIQSDNGDFYGSIESSLEANKYLRKVKDSVFKCRLASNYNNLGFAFNFLKNYKKSSYFYKEALKYIDNDENKFLCLNNIADVLITEGQYKLAESYLETALRAKNNYTLSKAINNYAKAKYLNNKNYNPLPELYKALEIRKADNDKQGLNSSYETLSTYYLEKDKNLSLSFAKEMYKIATENRSAQDRITALQRIISLEPESYYKNFTLYNSINDSLQDARNRDKNQFALVRFDVEKINTQNAEKDVRILQNKIIVMVLLFILLIGIVLYRRRKIRMEQEKLIEVKNTELKYSKKVHDVVANGLYHTMIEIQNQPDLDKEKVLNRIEKMYEESRDIAQDEVTEKDFYSRFQKMINSYSSEDQRVLPVGYNEDFWENISAEAQSEFYYIVREILVNMKKHSKAKLASLIFEKNQDYLRIKYTDNGVGIKDFEIEKGTGLRNTENRIASIHGDITFEENPKGGLIIQITVPKHSKYV